MSVTRTGSNKKFAAGWQSAFGKGGKKKAAPKKVVAKKTAKKN